MPLLPDVDRLLGALSLVALLLYLTPAVFETSELNQRRLQWAAIVALASGFAIAVAATVFGSAA